MTKTQFQYYRAIREFVSKHRYFPKFEDIAKMMQVQSSSSVHKIVVKLAEQGLIMKAGKQYELVPEKMHGLSNCANGHLPVWYMARDCPVCDLLARIPKAVS